LPCLLLKAFDTNMGDFLEIQIKIKEI
jgi:hypothetical protein